ncbi:aconitase A [Gottschalkia purinilytica]|uniref:Aconitase A n=1 Tax=Gottschalkia purinilytica TaxID=1503 RepID=A0A0L0W6J5_GOTPU|nr:hydratase [Gottschalkia purinilytica]KNF07112.1 aconitase A [Gottschalkia purinilytica]
MVTVINKGVFLYRGEKLLGVENEITIDDIKRLERNNYVTGDESISDLNPEKARMNTMTYKVIQNHNVSNSDREIKIKFDALASHDITYVGIIQTAKASGLTQFPIPYILTNCHNSLCAVGGTINEDDHIFGLSAAKKYGGIYVPAHQSVIHQYMREEITKCGSMILGSDSHTRYGALGTMAIGEGGPELVKQLLGKTYDFTYPEVIAVYLEGKPHIGVGPHDVALSIIGEVFKSGFVKNKVLEFVGPGISSLSVDFRNGIDVMTTETACLSSIWHTDDKVKEYYRKHGRLEDYSKIEPGTLAYYDGLIKVDLGKIEPMIALPFHPSNVYKISELNKYPYEILKEVEAEGQRQLNNSQIRFNLTDKIVNGRIKVNQGIVAGCAGGSFENIIKMATLLKENSIGNDYFDVSVYPASQPIYMELTKQGATENLMSAGVTIKTAFCGPCFGAGDVPNHNGLSIRHTTRNFPNREGSKPWEGQIASVALMDTLSITATALNGGILSSAMEIDIPNLDITYEFNKSSYNNRVFNGFKSPKMEEPLKYGPNISDWPELQPLSDNLLLKIASVINDKVTSTDELIPSGEASSYRSNPLKLAEFTLSRKDPMYVKRAKDIQLLEEKRKLFLQGNDISVIKDIVDVFSEIKEKENISDEELNELISNTSIGSTIFAIKPGDGSAREQAASCQRVLGGVANIAVEYATKRYRSNLINWGMIPFIITNLEKEKLEVDDYIFIPKIKEVVIMGKENITGKIISPKGSRNITFKLEKMTEDEKDIILSGSLINYYASKGR